MTDREVEKKNEKTLPSGLKLRAVFFNSRSEFPYRNLIYFPRLFLRFETRISVQKF